MKLTGSYEIKLDKNSVWKALNDPEILKKSIPGCEEFKKNSDTNFTATATNKIGPFNATFTGDIERNGITKLIYSVEANVGGKIAQVGSRLIDMTAKKMADIFFGKFSELLSSAEKKEDKKEDIKTVSEKSFDLKQINKKLLYATVVVVVLLAIYLLK